MLALVGGGLLVAPTTAADPPIPPAVDPGKPTFTGSSDPVPGEPAAFDPSGNVLEAIYQADLAAGGESFWFDRVLERPAGGTGGGNGATSLYTKGRALYMYNHNPAVLGFVGENGGGANQGGRGFAYREAVNSSGNAAATALYTVTISGGALTEQQAERHQFPSHWSSVHTGTGLSVLQRKFITENNVAVTVLTLANTDSAPTSRTITATTPGVVTQQTSADGTERTGAFNTRY